MTAVARTRRIQPGSRIRWIDVERAAFHAHRPVFDALPPPRRRIGTGEWAAMAGATIVVVFFWLASIVGYAVLYNGYRFGATTPDYERMIPVSGVLYLGALVYLIGAALVWVFGGRVPTYMNTVTAFTTGILGALAAFSIVQHGRAEGVENWAVWATVVAGVALGGFVVGTMFQLGSRRRVKEGPEAERRRAGIESLSPEERVAIRADLDAAIGELAERGLIDQAAAAAARDAELGFLAETMRAAGHAQR
ncbi:hypothetical protein [Cellulomonas fengjieae]|uniref:hypothetical protein n=1 Tax=Cellulomonas fengjieae TaxID=2819978 RepID=UPI001AAF44BD|nr:hypothetical protein [Cellulomonas fengjieae]MBO3101908.1 hypothetical protein [Cellulomonas fengjieae]